MILPRAWTKEDIEKIADLERRCFSDPWSETELDGCLSLPVYKTFLLEYDDGRLIAYGCLLTVCENAEILNIAVAPEERNKGHARFLMREMFETARQAGAETAFLEVRKSNESAKCLYHSLGFEKYGERKKYYPDGEDAILMAKPL